MQSKRWRPLAIFLYRHPIDMCKQSDGLVALVTSELGRHPADLALFVFRSRRDDWIKHLIRHLPSPGDRLHPGLGDITPHESGETKNQRDDDGPRVWESTAL